MLVLDASVISEYLIASALGRIAAARMERDAAALHIPHLAVVETTSVVRQWAARRLVPERRAQAALADLAAFPARRWAAEPLLPRIWELRTSLTAYDATYVALAEALDATLLTADARLARAHGPHCAIEVLAA